MSLSSILHPNRRQRRHAGQGEVSAAEAIKPVPDPDWARVPAAQVEAVRSASGPQPALRSFPGGALPAEDVPHRPQPHPYGPPRHAAAPGTHPFDAPLPQSLAERAQGHRNPGPPTQAFTAASAPEFAVAGGRPRPYAPENDQMWQQAWQLPPLPPGAEILPPAIGDHLAKNWPGPQGESQSWKTRQKTGSANYPRCDMNATFGDYGDFLRKVDEVTGAPGTNRWPLQALPAASPRWAALAEEALDASRFLADDDPEQAAAFRRLHRYVTAAPDCETAVRLAELAHEAGVIKRRLPAAIRDHAEAAA